jgi:hypothetical protein
MTKKTLNIGNLANELEQSKFFEHKKEQHLEESVRTGVRMNSSTGVQAYGRTAVRGKDFVTEKTTRLPFNIFEAHDMQIDWYVAEKKRSGKKYYNRSMLIRELLDKFFDREKRAGRMENFREQANG